MSPARFVLSAVAVVVGLARPGDALAEGAAGKPGTLTLAVATRNDAGQVGCFVYDAPKGFPTDPSAARQSAWCKISGRAASCSFRGLSRGTYAFACFHDENGNGKLDTNFLGIPTEGTVASNDAKGTLGPPSFGDAKFSYSGEAIEVGAKVRY